MTPFELSPDQLATLSLVSETPPWRRLSAKETATKLGVTVQALANWRYRDNGPPYQVSKSRKCYYRLADILHWLTGTPAWSYSKAWMVERGMVPEDASELHVQWVISLDPVA